MGIISKLRQPLSKTNTWYLNYKQKSASADDQFPNVKWLSHHVPKTGGSSFYQTLREAYGGKHIQAVYRYNDLPKILTTGKPVWLPQRIKLLHGHFRPHENHLQQFPNAKRIIWVRDPVERNISFLHHLLRMDHENNLKSNYFRKKYVRPGLEIEELFSLLMNDEELYSATRIYESFLKFKFDKSHFAFVGRMSHYSEDLRRLEEIMQTPLPEFRIGAKPEKTKDNIDVAYYSEVLKNEYILLNQMI